MWVLDQQHQLYLGAHQKSETEAQLCATDYSLYFSPMPNWFICTWLFEKLHSRGFSLCSDFVELNWLGLA